METIRLDRADGIVTITLEPSREEERHQRRDVGRTPRDVPRHRRQRRRSRRRHHRCRWRVLLRRRSVRRRVADGTIEAPARDDAPRRRRAPRAPPPPAADHRQGRRGRRRRRAATWRSVATSSSRATTPASREIFARRGLTIDFGGSWLLPRLIGMHKAKELALLRRHHLGAGRPSIGLVNRVVPAGRARQVRRRLGAPPRRRAADRSGADEAAAQRRVRGHARTGAGGRGLGADRELLDRRHRRGDGGVPGKARSPFQRTLNASRRPSTSAFASSRSTMTWTSAAPSDFRNKSSQRSTVSPVVCSMATAYAAVCSR